MANNSLKSKKLGSHLFIWVLILFTLFPIYVVVTSSFSPTGSLATSSLIPQIWSFDNYKVLFNNPAVPYLTWVKNSIVLAVANAAISVFVGTASAFAFSRMRFKGRKLGLQALLLVQVFPSFLALAAIYVMMERVYTVFPAIGLGSLGGLLLIYLGGSMGVMMCIFNFWVACTECL